jgi:pantoate--beta-alanine ligase
MNLSLGLQQCSAPATFTGKVVTTRVELRSAVSAARRAGQRIGFVPTMGALHAGHLSLVETSRAECPYTVVSIFVNPTQFGPQEDFLRYPRDLQADLQKLVPLSVDLVYAPPVEEMYGPGFGTFVDVAAVTSVLEGAFRPGHFRGVATVVLKLFQQVAPDVAYFGQKDYQQTVVIRRMVEDLDLGVKIVVCPTVREPDGLALSSRNVYLSPEERQQALVLWRSLQLAHRLVSEGEQRASVILGAMRGLFAAEPDVRLQYAALVDPDNLADVPLVTAPTLAAVAAFVGTTRLIDNRLLAPNS